MKNSKIFETDNAENCFRQWQNRHAVKLAELWGSYQKMGFDFFLPRNLHRAN